MAAINVSVDESLKQEVTEVYERLGLSVQDAIRIFLRRSAKAGGFPFDMRIDEEVRHSSATGEGVLIYKTTEGSLESSD